MSNLLKINYYIQFIFTCIKLRKFTHMLYLSKWLHLTGYVHLIKHSSQWWTCCFIGSFRGSRTKDVIAIAAARYCPKTELWFSYWRGNPGEPATLSSAQPTSPGVTLNSTGKFLGKYSAVRNSYVGVPAFWKSF